MNNTKQALDELRQDVERNPSAEGRATTYVERTTRLYREAHAAKDWDQVKTLTEEIGRNVTEFGQAIATPKQQTGRAGA